MEAEYRDGVAAHPRSAGRVAGCWRALRRGPLVAWRGRRGPAVHRALQLLVALGHLRRRGQIAASSCDRSHRRSSRCTTPITAGADRLLRKKHSQRRRCCLHGAGSHSWPARCSAQHALARQSSTMAGAGLPRRGSRPAARIGGQAGRLRAVEDGPHHRVAGCTMHCDERSTAGSREARAAGARDRAHHTMPVFQHVCHATGHRTWQVQEPCP